MSEYAERFAENNIGMAEFCLRTPSSLTPTTKVPFFL
jgi:hypothetical protein